MGQFFGHFSLFFRCRRGDDTPGNHQFYGFLNGHLQENKLLPGHKEQIPGCGVGGCRHEDVDGFGFGDILHFALRYPRYKADGVYPFSGVFEHDRFAKSRRLARHNRFKHLLDPAVYRADHRHTVEHVFIQAYDKTAQNIGCEPAYNDEEGYGDDKAKAGDSRATIHIVVQRIWQDFCDMGVDEREENIC